MILSQTTAAVALAMTSYFARAQASQPIEAEPVVSEEVAAAPLEPQAEPARSPAEPSTAELEAGTMDSSEEDWSTQEEFAAPAFNVALHAYGNWYAGRTTDNAYLAGDSDGAYDTFDFALAPVAEIGQDVLLLAQVSLARGGTHLEEGVGEQLRVGLDTAFAQWCVADYFKIQAGRNRTPFGLYSLIFSVGTLQPFDALPQGIYGTTGTIPAYYQGLGVTGRLATNSGWALEYDVYGGEMDLFVHVPFEHISEHEEEGEHEHEEEGDHGHEEADSRYVTESVSHMFGGKLTLETPWAGLRLGGSGTAGRAKEHVDEVHYVLGAHLELMTHDLTLRAEFLRHLHASLAEEEDHEHGHGHAEAVTAAYAEVSYLVTDWLRLAGRYDYGQADVGDMDISEAPSLVKHHDIGFAVNYLLGANLVVKLAYHYVSGNLHAHPFNHAVLDRKIEAGSLSQTTHLVSFGISFAY